MQATRFRLGMWCAEFRRSIFSITKLHAIFVAVVSRTEPIPRLCFLRRNGEERNNLMERDRIFGGNIGEFLSWRDRSPTQASFVFRPLGGRVDTASRANQIPFTGCSRVFIRNMTQVVNGVVILDSKCTHARPSLYGKSQNAEIRLWNPPTWTVNRSKTAGTQSTRPRCVIIPAIEYSPLYIQHKSNEKLFISCQLLALQYSVQ